MFDAMLDVVLDRFDRQPPDKFRIACGVLTRPDLVRQHYLDPDQERTLHSSFDRIVVAADRRVWDVAAEYALEKEIADKIEYVGYMSEIRERRRNRKDAGRARRSRERLLDYLLRWRRSARRRADRRVR
jgi:predicted glycosyltransferase